MSKARLVITAVIIEGRSQSEVALEYGVSQGWISRLVKRYRLEGEAAFEPRSRRPHTSPTRLPQSLIDLIIALRDDLSGKGLDHGPRVLILVQDLDIHIINAATGDLTRQLTLDPTRDYQPAGAPKGPKRIKFRT